MNKEKMKYVENPKSDERIFRTELLLAPLLVLIPFVVGLIFINDWYSRGFITGSSEFDGELILGMIIIVGNIVFDIPFLRSLRNFRVLFKKSKN